LPLLIALVPINNIIKIVKIQYVKINKILFMRKKAILYF